MSRTIKFRAWSKSRNKFIYRVCVGNTQTDDPCSSIWLDEEAMWAEFPQSCGTIQQFTGLLDSKGKEIYEGDIVCRKAADLTYTVVYTERYARFMTKDVDGDESPLHLIAGISEVIGNVFENPELCA